MANTLKLIITLYAWEPVRVGSNLSLQFKIKNESAVHYKGGRLHVIPDNYYQESSIPLPAIPAFTERENIAFKNVEVIGGRTIADLPSRMCFKITELPNYVEVVRSNITPPMKLFSLELALMKPSPPQERYNILLFGMAGATKSSFVNSTLTMLNSSITTVSAAGEGGASKHNTTALIRYNLEGTNISLWDTWGLTQQTYNSNELDCILEGVFPSNWSMDIIYDQHKQVLEANKGGRISRQIHGILFFCPQGSLADPNKEPERQIIRTYFDKMAKARYNPLLMLTKVDEVNPQVRENPAAYYDDLEALRNKASSMLNIGLNRIFYNINYTKETIRNFAIDAMTYQILDRVVRNAQGWVHVEYNQTLDSKKQSNTTSGFLW